MRREPPPSVPIASGPRPAATAALAPPLEPPGVRSVFHGFRVIPKRRLWGGPIQPNGGAVVARQPRPHHLHRRQRPAPDRDRHLGGRHPAELVRNHSDLLPLGWAPGLSPAHPPRLFKSP